MILQDYVEIKICKLNAKYYLNLGYDIKIIKDSRGRDKFDTNQIIKVELKHLRRNSRIKVLCKCEVCGKERFITYDSLVNRPNSSYNNSGETLCSTCANGRMSGENNSNYKHGNNRYCEYRCRAKK